MPTRVPVSGTIPAVKLRILQRSAEQGVDLHGGEEHVGRAQGKHAERTRQATLLLVFPVAPQGPAAQPQAREEPVLHFQARAVVVVEAVLTEPALARGGQQAHFGITAEEPTRPHIDSRRTFGQNSSLYIPGG